MLFSVCLFCFCFWLLLWFFRLAWVCLVLLGVGGAISQGGNLPDGGRGREVDAPLPRPAQIPLASEEGNCAVPPKFAVRAPQI